MAFTEPTQAYKYGKVGTAVKIYSAITTTGAKTPFCLLSASGQYWAQVTFQVVLTSVTVLAATLEIDLSGVDANFVTLISGLDYVANKANVLNLSGGDARYRFNFGTVTGTSFDMWAIIA